MLPDKIGCFLLIVLFGRFERGLAASVLQCNWLWKEGKLDCGSQEPMDSRTKPLNSQPHSRTDCAARDFLLL